MTQVFISYSRRDLAFVQKLAQDLRAAGLDVWYDLSGLEVGTKWGKEIQNAIQLSKYLIVVLSPNSVESEWVEREFLYASNRKLKIIPLVYKTCDMPLWSLNLHYMDMRGEYQPSLGILLELIGVKPAVGEVKGKVIENKKPSQVPTETIPELEEKKKISSPVKKKSGKWGVIFAGLVGLMGIGAAAVILFPRIARQMAPQTTLTRTSQATFMPSITQTIPVKTTSTPSRTIGSTLVRESDGMTMVYVPEGEFSMGSADFADAVPVHIVRLDAFWIDRSEVTNEMFARCVRARACGEPQNESYQPNAANAYKNPAYAAHPVIYRDQGSARDYCNWAGGRLPTEAEWEKAARGTDRRKFPWGNTLDASLANFCDRNCSMDWADKNSNDGYATTSPVGAFPQGASPYGALDMAGNAWEWVQDAYGKDYYNASPKDNPQGPGFHGENQLEEFGVLRGGAWNAEFASLNAAKRISFMSSGPMEVFGFRCAMDVTP